MSETKKCYTDNMISGFNPSSIFESFLSLWWLWAFFILIPLAHGSFVAWRNELFKKREFAQYIILEIHVPREIHKNPRAMEQVLSSIHSLRNDPGDFQEYYLDGEVTRWFSLEIVSFGGEIHLYIRLPKKQKALIEAAFFGYYQDLELTEVDDYTERLPTTVGEMYAEGYEMWAAEMLLVKSAGYPIKTYEDFESPDEESQYDPMSAFLEVLSKTKPEEVVGVQFLIAPIGPHWKKQFEPLVEELRNKIQPTPKALGVEGEIKPFSSLMRTPGETDTLTAVEDNLAHSAFETIVRFIYLSPKELFYDSFPRRGITGAFNQYSAINLNSFVPNYRGATRTKVWNWPYVFPGIRNEYKKQRLLYNYRHFKFPPKTFMEILISSYFFDWDTKSKTYPMTTKCLATIFHPPTHFVLTAPHMKRVESKKAGPPAGLAIFGDKDALDSFSTRK